VPLVEALENFCSFIRDGFEKAHFDMHTEPLGGQGTRRDTTLPRPKGLYYFFSFEQKAIKSRFLEDRDTFAYYDIMAHDNMNNTTDEYSIFHREPEQECHLNSLPFHLVHEFNATKTTSIHLKPDALLQSN